MSEDVTGDIVATMPWWCGEDGHTWHKNTYWLYSDGSASMDPYSDGDHTPCDDDDLPDPDQEVREWARYRVWAVDNQSDPLGEFMRGVPARDSEDAEAIRNSGELRLDN